MNERKSKSDAGHFTTCTFHTRGLEYGQCHNRDPIMENLDNRISVNRDVIPPGSLPTGNPECARFIAAPRKIYEKRTNRSIARFYRIDLITVSQWIWKICFPSRFSEPRDRRFVGISEKSTIRSNLGKLGERWKRREKVEGPPSLGTGVDGVSRGNKVVVTKLIRRL